MPTQPLTVGQVATLAHLTVRALHHYDATGLVLPSFRSGAGYRLYSDDDLRRLQKVLLFREFGFSLDDVRTLIDASPQRQREALLCWNGAGIRMRYWRRSMRPFTLWK
jgi:MerR family transcriptional regulator, thiopeptide resistance regulator